MVANTDNVIGLGFSMKTSTFNVIANIVIETLLAEYIVQNKAIDSAVFNYQGTHEINYR